MLTTTVSTIPIIGSNNNIFKVGSPLFYIVIGAGSSILILLLVILTMLAAMCLLVTTRGKSYTLALDEQSGDSSRESSNSQGQGTIIIVYDLIIYPILILQALEWHWWSQYLGQTQYIPM